MALVQNASPANLSGFPQSQLLASFDAVQPDFRTTLFNQYGDQFDKEMRFIYDMGAKRAVKNAGGGFHFEEERFDRAITVKANAGTSGTTLSFTLADADIETVSGERYSYPAIGDLFINPVNGQRFEITNKTDNGTNTTITAISIDGQTAATPSAGVQYGIYSQASDENSDTPAVKESYWTKYNYKLQRIRTAGRVTGDTAGNELYAQTDELGNFVGNWIGFERMTTEWRHLKSIIGMTVLGKQGSAGNSTSNGMMETFAARANSLDISGGVDVDSLYETSDLLKPNSTPNNIIALLGANIYTPLSQSIGQGLSNQNIEAARRKSAELIFGSGEQSEGMMATYDFNTIIINGQTFNLRSFDLSFDPVVFGLNRETNQFASTAYFMPSTKTSDAEGMPRRYMELNYLSNSAGRVDRLMSVVELGRNAAIPTNGVDNLTIDFLTQAGLDFYAMKQCAYWYDATLS